LMALRTPVIGTRNLRRANHRKHGFRTQPRYCAWWPHGHGS
jgi:hypothetical protein